jgi:hypothetical protein
LLERVPFRPAAAGRHWSSAAEFDVVLLDESRRNAFVAEVKWSAAKVGVDVLEDLRARVAREPAFATMKCTCAVIARNGFTGRGVTRAGDHLIDVSKVKW